MPNPKRLPLLPLALTLAAAVLIGCPDHRGVVQGAGEQTVAERLSAPLARAWTIERATDLFQGAGARGRLGDVAMGNDQARFVISAIDHPAAPGASGGHLIDAGLRGEAINGSPRRVAWSEPAGPRDPRYTELTIVEAQGEEAIVVVTGFDSADAAIRLTTRYTLPARGAQLKIETIAANTDEARTVTELLPGQRVSYDKTVSVGSDREKIKEDRE